MDEQNMNNQIPVAEVPAQPVIPTTSVTSTASVAYASFGARFLAGLIDCILVSIVTGALGALFGFGRSGGGNTFSSYNPFSILALVYYVLMISKYGATIGKKVLGIRVQDEQTGANLTIGGAILREVVGKFLSGIVFLLGYFWMLWDPKKQTWHDKIAKSIVVKVK
jgi:uncharacterized RDD family membrane protein YckC